MSNSSSLLTSPSTSNGNGKNREVDRKELKEVVGHDLESVRKQLEEALGHNVFQQSDKLYFGAKSVTIADPGSFVFENDPQTIPIMVGGKLLLVVGRDLDNLYCLELDGENRVLFYTPHYQKIC